MRQTLKECDLYEIDQDGNFYKKSNGRKLDCNCPQIALSNKDGWSRTFYRKNVIANNLVPNPNNYKLIVFKDKDKDNYHPSNLMWAETIYGNPIFDKKTDAHIRNKMNVIIRNCYGRIKDGKQYSAHKQYGAKGIKVHEEWHDTLKFLSWAKESGYFPGAWLCRYNKNKDYCPDNCYWGEPNILKLTCDMVEEIKEMDLPRKKIANKYSITSERVRQIKKGKTLKACE